MHLRSLEVSLISQYDEISCPESLEAMRNRISFRLAAAFCTLGFSLVCLIAHDRARTGLDPHRHWTRRREGAAGRSRFQSRHAGSKECGTAEDIQRHAMERSRQCRHLRHGFEEFLSAQTCPGTLPMCISMPGARRRRMRPCWPLAILGVDRQRAGAWLALRREEHRLAAGAGQAIHRHRDHGRSAH